MKLFNITVVLCAYVITYNIIVINILTDLSTIIDIDGDAYTEEELLQEDNPSNS